MMNGTATANQINSFLCPSDTGLANLTYFVFSPNGPQKMVGRHSYPFNTGLNPWTAAGAGAANGPAYYPGWVQYANLLGNKAAAAIAAQQTVEMASFVDGTSNTAVFSEWIRGDGIPPPGSANGLGQVYNFAKGDSLTTYVGQAGPGGVKSDYLYAQDCYNTPQIGTYQNWTWKGDWWASGQSATYSHTQLPNRTSCYYSDFGQPQSCAPERAGGQLAASGRRQRCVRRWLGPLRQVVGGPPAVVRHRHRQRRRGGEFRLLLIATSAPLVAPGSTATGPIGRCVPPRSAPLAVGVPARRPSGRPPDRSRGGESLSDARPSNCA